VTHWRFAHEPGDDLRGLTLRLVGTLFGLFGTALVIGAVRGVFVYGRPVATLLPGVLALIGAAVAFKLSFDAVLSRDREEARFWEHFASVHAEPRGAVPGTGRFHVAAGPGSRYVPECLRVLGLPRGCTEPEVRRAFRRLARRLHPDVGGDAEAFMRLEAAYRQALRLVRRASIAAP
jgi:hypothetical protein